MSALLRHTGSSKCTRLSRGECRLYFVKLVHLHVQGRRGVSGGYTSSNWFIFMYKVVEGLVSAILPQTGSSSCTRSSRG